MRFAERGASSFRRACDAITWTRRSARECRRAPPMSARPELRSQACIRSRPVISEAINQIEEVGIVDLAQVRLVAAGNARDLQVPDETDRLPQCLGEIPVSE